MNFVKNVGGISGTSIMLVVNMFIYLFIFVIPDIMLIVCTVQYHDYNVCSFLSPASTGKILLKMTYPISKRKKVKKVDLE